MYYYYYYYYYYYISFYYFLVCHCGAQIPALGRTVAVALRRADDAYKPKLLSTLKLSIMRPIRMSI